MLTHLRRHHPSAISSSSTGTRKKAPVAQTPLLAAFKHPFNHNSNRAKAITTSIGAFIASDLRPYSVVIEPRYEVPSRPHFSQKVIPDLYKQTKSAVLEELSKACAIALTTDGWTSRANESYITVTAHPITPEWNIASQVLQSRAMHEQHTSANLAEGLKEAVLEWNLERPGTTIAVTTDNARNKVNAVIEAGMGPQIGCFAHTINLASQKATSLNQLARLLGKVRRVVTFFHRSLTAAHILERKQEMLSLAKHCLIQDVSTRWNSSYDMLVRYLEQQAAVYTGLTEQPLKKKDISTLSDQVVRRAEEVIVVLKPLKTPTTVINRSYTFSIHDPAPQSHSSPLYGAK